MKKLISAFTILVTLSCSAFANFFSNRIFEFKTNMPFSISNNSIGVFDIFTLYNGDPKNKAIYQTEEDGLVLDLKNFAKQMPKSGFNTTFLTNPTIDTKLTIKNVSIGTSLGLDMYLMAGLTKGLFDFLGTGNVVEGSDSNDMEVGVNAAMDVFAYNEINTTIKLKKKKISFTVAPAVFIPVVHAFTDNAVAKISNDSEGNIKITMNALAKIYSVESPSVVDEISAIPTDLLNSFGVDLRGAVSYSFTKHFTAAVDFRIPIFPGRLRNAGVYSYSIEDYSTSLSDFMTNGFTAPQGTLNAGEWDSDSVYYINRPLKFDITGTLKPLGSFLTIQEGLGFGIKNPFAADIKEVKFYPEYLMGLRLSLFDILSISATTEYTNQIFAHSIALSFNLRFTELDVGVSAQSTNFVKSLSGGGAGAYITMIMGF